MANVIENKYDFVLLFDVENGNPNGDPDAGNMPRVDAETGHGLVTDVCIKRKVRNYIQLCKNDTPPYKIFIKEILNEKLTDAYKEVGIKPKTNKAEEIKLAQAFMCENYYDVRTFGAVMSTGDCPCGVVRGPIQLTFGRSIDPISPQEITITRMAVTNAKDVGKDTEMGKKSFVPYGLYRMEGYVSPMLAQNITLFSEEDLVLFWEALINMFENDRSAARGKMIVRKLIVFKHESPLGNTPSHKLFDRVSVKKVNPHEPARKYEDYQVVIDKENIPQSVILEEKV